MKKKTISGRGNFYFQDYDYSENIKDPSKSEMNISFNRVSFIFFIFVVIGFIYSIKIVYLASINNKNYFINSSHTKLLKTRQEILDKNDSDSHNVNDTLNSSFPRQHQHNNYTIIKTHITKYLAIRIKF